MEKLRTSTIETFRNNTNSGKGGFLNARMNKIPKADSLFLIAVKIMKING
jgi:hypothetical protein